MNQGTDESESLNQNVIYEIWGSTLSKTRGRRNGNNWSQVEQKAEEKGVWLHTIPLLQLLDHACHLFHNPHHGQLSFWAFATIIIRIGGFVRFTDQQIDQCQRQISTFLCCDYIRLWWSGHFFIIIMQRW